MGHTEIAMLTHQSAVGAVAVLGLSEQREHPVLHVAVNE